LSGRLTLAALPAALLAASCGGAPESRNMTANEVAEELAEIRIEPGLWEVRSEVVSVSAPGLPLVTRNRMVGPRPTVRNCITPEQAARPNSNFLSGGNTGNCAYRDFSMDGGRMRGAMTCRNEDPPGITEAAMDGTHRPGGYDMTMRMETQLPGGGVMQVETRTQGRRLGECPAGGDPNANATGEEKAG
jgi:hypothetical protein